MFSLGSFLDVRKEDRPLLYYTYYAFLVSGMMSTVLGAILPSLSAEYGLSYSVQGSLLSFHQIGNLAAVYLAGFLSLTPSAARGARCLEPAESYWDSSS